jgi:puromycin-sensitive aminopeptidase
VSRARAVVLAALGAWPAAASAARSPAFVPSRYELSLAPGHGRSFSGHETIEGRLPAPARAITLDAVELHVAEARVRVGDATLAARVVEAPAGHVTLALPYAVAGEVRVELAWSGALSDDLSGLFALDDGGRRALFTDFEPAGARRVFPCVDEPAHKARFALSVDVDADDVAVSNTPIVERVPLPGRRQRVRFAETPPLPTYLVALATGRFATLRASAGETPVRVIATREQLPLAQLALDTATALLPRFEAWFARPYPFAKLDLVAVPALAPGGMENAGAIFLRDDRLLVDAAHASPATIHAVTLLIAHELAHQWAGDLATPASWSDLWLAEATATYVAHEVVAAWHPEWRPWDELQPAIDDVMGEDELAATHPVRATDGGHALFDAIVYTKGAALLRMLAGWIGDDAVQAALRHLVAAGAYDNISADDWWTALDEVAREPIAGTVRNWFEERGHPVVEVAASECREGRRTFHLRRAYERPGWTVPVTLRWPGGERRLLLGDEASVEVDGCPAWIDANAGRLGFYRVRYDAPLLTALGDVAETELAAAERAGLLADTWLAVRAGAPLGDYFALASKLRGERSPAVLDELGRRLAFAAAQLVRPAERSTFERFADELFAPSWAALGWTARSGDDDATRIARGRVLELLGAVARAPAILQEADRRVRQYLVDPRSVDGALADALAQLGAQTGDGARYHAYLARLPLAHTPEEQERLREALPRFEKPALQQRTLSLLLTGAVPADAIIRFAADLAGSSAGPAAWRFFKSHFDALERKAPRTGWLLPASERLCDDGAARDVGRFVTLRAAETSERIARCAALRQRATVELAAWLHARYAEARTGGTR